jgi:hypothetical protein
MPERQRMQGRSGRRADGHVLLPHACGATTVVSLLYASRSHGVRAAALLHAEKRGEAGRRLHS